MLNVDQLLYVVISNIHKPQKKLLEKFAIFSKNRINTEIMVGNNVEIIDCSCNGKNKSLSPSTTQYRPLLNEGQEMSSSAMKNWQWHQLKEKAIKIYS